MKTFVLSAFTLAAAVTAPLPVLAQSAETPMQIAARVDACEGREVLSARMTDDNRLAVTCGKAAGSTGPVVSTQNNNNTRGLGGGVGALVIIGGIALIGGTSSSSDTQ